jgi:cell fate regulator YaaT (PSP1 superfamily)
MTGSYALESPRAPELRPPHMNEGTFMPMELELMPQEERLPDAPPSKTLVVRYGRLREIGEFPSDLTQKVGCGTKLVIRTDRGTEIAEMLTTTCSNGGCPKSITREQLLAYIDKSGGRNYPFTEQGRVLRVASSQDLLEQTKLDENHNPHLTMARDLVRTHKLSMKIVDVEHLLGGERILFYFVSEHRVDFRSLVRDLAHSLHTRIELRQVGARDDARLTADYEKCGQHCCCRQFLKALTPISMRAAKVQKATLDPTKISGRCGRLMCCLRYEDKTYEELRKKLPKRNTRVATEKGDAWVIDGQILTQLVLCQYDDGTREAVPLERITAFDRPKPVMADGRTMQTPNDRPPMMAGDMPPRRNGAGAPAANGAPPQRRPRFNDAGVPAGASAPSGTPPIPAANGTASPGSDMIDERSLSALDDDFDDLLADALDDQPASPTPGAPADGAPASSNPPLNSAPSSSPEQQPARLPRADQDPRAGGPPRQNQNPQRPPQNRPPQQQQRGPRGPQNQPQRGRGGPQGQRPPQPQRNQPFRPPQQQPPQQNQRRMPQPPSQISPTAPTAPSSNTPPATPPAPEASQIAPPPAAPEHALPPTPSPSAPPSEPPAQSRDASSPQGQ